MINKHIRCEKYITHFLNYFNVSENTYTLGTTTNNSICVLECENGYLVFEVLNYQKQNEILVSNFFDVVREIYQRTNFKKNQEKKLKLKQFN